MHPRFEAASLAAAGMLGIFVACGFPEYGGFAQTTDAPSGTGGTSNEGGQAGSTGGGGNSGLGGAGGMAGTGGLGQSGASDAGDADAGASGTGLDADAEAPNEAGPPTLVVSHVPTETAGTSTMRDPVWPKAGESFVLTLRISPSDSVESATAFWSWTGDVQPTPFPMTYSGKDGESDLWSTSVEMPVHAVGTFTYTFEISPLDAEHFSTTYVYGNETTSHSTQSRAEAEASPYSPPASQPKPGEVVITEVMVNTLGDDLASKEWFEVYCAADQAISLDGLVLSDSDTASHTHTIKASTLILWPGTYATLAGSRDPVATEGFTADYGYGNNMQFNNSGGDAVNVMLADRTVIDSVAFTESWPYSDARTMQHTGFPPSAVGNDSKSAWCLSQLPYGDGTSYGTPNAVTDSCAK